jgi:hypothetical protein
LNFSLKLLSWCDIFAGGLELTQRFFYRKRFCTLFGREFKIFSLGSDNKAEKTVVLELDIESVGFSDGAHLFEIKLATGVSHEFKCENMDDFIQWKRALSDYRGSPSSAVETATAAGFVRKLFCIFAQEHMAEGFEHVLGGSNLEESGDAEEAPGGTASDDDENESVSGDFSNSFLSLGGGLATDFLDE